MEEIRDALVGYALANGYLPCPDAMTALPGTTPNDGTADFDAVGDCLTQSGTLSVGNLPWATLGLASKDAWGNRFRYIVLTAFTRQTPVFTITTPVPPAPNAFQLCENAACTSVISNNHVAMIISHGNNGLGAMNASTNLPNPSPPLTAIDEQKNTDTTLNKVSHPKSTIANNEFDDIVITLSRFTLINRMVAAGKLP